MRRAWRGESGQTSLEFVGLIPYLLLIAVACWQFLLASATANAAENAARAGSRAEGLGLNGAERALEALPEWLRGTSDAEVGPGAGCGDDGGSRPGTRVVVCAPVPILFPGVTLPDFVMRRDAEFPSP
jgi:TadE-like protein